MRTSCCVTAIAAVILCCRAALAGDGVEIAWSFEKDQKRAYKVCQKSEVTFDIPTKGPSTTLVQLDLTPVFEAASVKQGPVATATMKCWYDTALFHLDVPSQGGLHFDSESEAERQAARVDKFKAAVLGLATPKAFKFSCVPAANGGVSKVSGHGKYVPRAFSPQLFKDAVPIAACVLCQQLLADSAVEDALCDVFPPLPKGSSLPGDKWKGESAAVIYPLGKFIFTSEFVLKEIKEGKTAVITCTSDTRRDPTVDPGFGLPAKDDPSFGTLKDALKKMTIKESKREGEFEFDLEKKEISKGKVTLEMQVGASINAFGQNIDMQFKVTHSRTVERKEIESKEKD